MRNAQRSSSRPVATTRACRLPWVTSLSARPSSTDAIASPEPSRSPPTDWRLPQHCARSSGALGSFDFAPDVVISGINAGANVGRSVLHSGTVGAVFTAAQLGLSGLAVSVQWGDNVHYDTAAAVAIAVLDELFSAPPRTVLNLNVPNLGLHQLKGVRRGHISTAGVIKAAGPRAGGEALSEEGELPLRLGAASPALGDVSDEEPNDDGALVESGYASLTPLHGPREVTDPAFDALMEKALEAASRQLST